MSKILKRGAAAVTLGLALTSLSVAHANAADGAKPRITAAAEDSTVKVGDEVFLYGDAFNVPRGTKFLIQHRMGNESWRTIGHNWLGVKVGHHYRVFTDPTEVTGTNYYRVKIPARPHRSAAVSKPVAVQVS